MSKLTESPAWQALHSHAERLRGTRMADLLQQDPARAERDWLEAAGLQLCYARQLATPETLELLHALARQQQLERWIARLFAGEAVNATEGRAALHMALRAPRGKSMKAGGEDVSGKVHAVLDRLCRFADEVRGGTRTGHTGERFTDVVNLGIGGSDLGPRMVCDALAGMADGPRTHFVSNVDGAHLHRVLRPLRPETTLVIVTSKTFTTQETMANAGNARRWLVEALGEAAVGAHFVAVSTNLPEVQRFGIDAARCFEFWEWVGGRYSLWSAVGLPIVLGLGPARFREMLGGAHAMDEHFRSAPPEQNLPVRLGLLAVWNRSFLGCGSQVLAPYAQDLEKFVSWLQQLEMESNGKGVDRDGRFVDYPTTPVLWGDVGTNAQHAFFQMLHQGPDRHAVDFILPLEAGHAYAEQHRMLLANCLAQSAALMSGRGGAPQEACPGDRPSNTLLMPRLDAFHLGALLALYEHRTFVQSVLWNINAFDQYGVELGKRIAKDVLKALEGGAVQNLDPITAALVARVPRRRG